LYGLFNPACAESPYKLVPHQRCTTQITTIFTILTMAKCKRRLPERRWHRATDAASGNWELETYMREKRARKKAFARFEIFGRARGSTFMVNESREPSNGAFGLEWRDRSCA